MKKKIVSILLVAVMILPLIAFTGCTTEKKSGYITPTNDEPAFVFNESKTIVREDEDPSKNTTFVLAEENDNYALYFSEGILEIALQNKKTGEVWYSNPTQSEREKGIKSEMSSQLTLFYLNKENGSQKTLESFMDCILNKNDETGLNQYYVVNHGGHLRVVYILGQIKPDYCIPTCLDEDRAVEYIDKLKNTEGYLAVSKYISGGSIYSKITPTTWASYPSDRQDELLAIAPNMEDYIKEGKAVYIIGDNTKWNNNRVMSQIQDGFVNVIGLSVEERDKINEDFGVVIDPAKNFYIPVDYTLTENGLTVNIPNEEIQYDTNTFAISTLNVLQYFGSASEKEEGYMFVPDGSGSIVKFNNGKTNISDSIKVQLYGLDDGREISTRPYFNEQGNLPVFGIKKATSAMFAIIESGDANATIVADIAGKNTNVQDRNRCYTSFKLSEYMEMEFKSSGKTSRIYQSKRNAADITVSYTILDGEKANYSGMAEYYRNYLIDKGVLKKKDFSSVPFNIEIVGAYDHKTAFLGVSYTEMRALTTFDQCQELIQKLYDAGITNISLNYKGWANNGLRNSAFNRAKVLNSLGGKSGLADLLAFADKLGVNLYFETELALVYESEMFDGFSQLTQASRYVSRDIAHHFQYVTDWNTASKNNDAIIVSPSVIYNIRNIENSNKGYATKLLNDLNKLNVKGVSLGSLGYNLPGNYKIKDFYDRADTAKTYLAVAEKYAESMNVMAKKANAYMLPYVNSIFEISNTSSMFNLTDASVPFYQMVIHGSVEYSGEPINLNGDARKTFLQAVEAGSGMYYRWCYASNGDVKDLWFDGMYSLSYESWIDDAIKMYKEYNDILGATADEYIVAHENVAEDVNKVTYSDGTTIYVNYNSYDYTAADGTVVKAESFAKGGNN